MKKLFSWIVVVLVLILILAIRIVIRTHSKPKFLFKKQNIVKIEFKDKDNKDVVIKKEKDKWYVLTSTGTYLGDEQKCKTLTEKIKELQITDMITKNPSSHEIYQLNETSATHVKIYFGKNKLQSKTIWFGKTGGFTYNECYIKIDNLPYVYLSRGLTADEFKKYFYDFCNRTILKSNREKITYIRVKVDNKLYEYKKELKDSTTIWVNIKTSKQVDFNKVDSYLRFFDEFISDTIIEPTDYDVNKIISSVIETNLKYDDGTEIVLYFYDKIPVKMPEHWRADTSVTYPVKIKCLTSKGPSVEFIGAENLIYGIYDFRFKDFKEKPTKF
jgi:hypothetical protein